jgi:hypothetical protein
LVGAVRHARMAIDASVLTGKKHQFLQLDRAFWVVIFEGKKTLKNGEKSRTFCKIENCDSVHSIKVGFESPIKI